MNLRACALLAAALLQAQTGALVEGKVTNTATGQPVKRAVVMLRTISDSATAPSYLCQTDAEGRFSVKDVAAGRYEAEASRQGFQARPPDRAASAGYFPRFTVEAGRSPGPLDLRLTPLGVIAGRIADERGQPLARTSVFAMRYRYAGGKKVLRSAAQAEANYRGEYRLFDLPPGRYYLQAIKYGGDPEAVGGVAENRGPGPYRIFAKTYYPGTPDAARAAALDLAPGAELNGVDVTVPHVPVYLIRGRALPNATVMAYSPSGEIYPITDYRSRPDLRPGGFETYAPPGTCFLNSSAYDPATNRNAILALRRVEVIDKDLDGIDLTASTAAAISGRVRIADPAAGPLEKLRVSLEPEEPANRTGVDCPVNPDGNFTLKGVQPDAFVVKVQAPAGAYLKTVRLGDRELPGHRFYGGDTGVLSLDVATDTGTIQGTLVDGRGVPAARVQVVLIPDRTLPYWHDLFQSVPSDAVGAFTFRAVVPGSYKLFAWADVEAGAPEDPDFRKPFEAQGVAVQLAPAAAATVRVTVIP